MRLKTVFVRFYKSFNYDYLRKFRKNPTEYPWEHIGEMWYPFVRVAIEPDVTTVVGANESGKTHLLSAIEKGITGAAIAREDFCRYSHLFSVERGQMKWPDFGFEWINVTEPEAAVIRELIGLGEKDEVSHFLCFRRDKNLLDVYIPKGAEFAKYPLDQPATKKLEQILPTIYKIDPEVALPDTVPLRYLMNSSDEDDRKVHLLSRADRYDLLEGLEPIQSEWVASADAMTRSAAQLAPVLSGIASLFRKPRSSDAGRKKEKSLRLARELLLRIAEVDENAIRDLYNALREGREGHVNSLMDRINERIAARLNFPRWWAQDKDFALIVSARDTDLVFTIRDRTGTNYSFGERSQGLKFFLSYYVQYKSHFPEKDRSEILLMDEPDAFLSSQAQQDLVRVFQAFADPPDGKNPIQVVYVTHSPFLIDKNHAERIRVLEKGSGDEGTRVVGDASKNHYEPLRSAFGAFVAETAFIGTCNLFVEGIADQVLLAGASAYLRKQGASSLEFLDLNSVTVVPAGSAEHIPYLAFLARGRDVEKPALIALLDSDGAGDKAKKRLLRDDLRHKQLLKSEYVLQIGELYQGDDPAHRWSKNQEIEIEDLIPPSLCAQATKENMQELGAPGALVDAISAAALSVRLDKGDCTWNAVAALVQDASNGDFHIEKVGFARGIIAALKSAEVEAEAKTAFAENMAKLFRRLGAMQTKATRERSAIGLAQRLDRARSAFLLDNPVSAKRERALILLEEMENALDNSWESDATKLEILKLRRDFDLDTDLTKVIADYDKFKKSLEKIRYTGRIASQSDSLDEGDNPPADTELVGLQDSAPVTPTDATSKVPK